MALTQIASSRPGGLLPTACCVDDDDPPSPTHTTRSDSWDEAASEVDPRTTFTS